MPPVTSTLEFIRKVYQTEPVDAAIMFVQSATAPDPKDPLYLPYSRAAAINSFRIIVGHLTADEQAEVVRQLDDQDSEGFTFADAMALR